MPPIRHRKHSFRFTILVIKRYMSSACSTLMVMCLFLVLMTTWWSETTLLMISIVFGKGNKNSRLPQHSTDITTAPLTRCDYEGAPCPQWYTPLRGMHHNGLTTPPPQRGGPPPHAFQVRTIPPHATRMRHVVDVPMLLAHCGGHRNAGASTVGCADVVSPLWRAPHRGDVHCGTRRCC